MMMTLEQLIQKKHTSFFIELQFAQMEFSCSTAYTDHTLLATLCNYTRTENPIKTVNFFRPKKHSHLFYSVTFEYLCKKSRRPGPLQLHKKENKLTTNWCQHYRIATKAPNKKTQTNKPSQSQYSQQRSNQPGTLQQDLNQIS